VSLSNTPGSIRCRAPLLGEHTDAILSSLGYTPAEIAALRDKRVI
jgi:crotonobetainyl-CoA:carnitine CoA-transferase CaiB-like acyl-CoA transferase